MTPLTDRRACVRYEVVGRLQGTLEHSEIARLVNISGAGALVEAARPIQIGTIQTIQMTLGGRPTLVNSRVRHLSNTGQMPGHGPYVIGVEFLSPPDELVTSIAHLAGDTETD